MAVTAIEFDFTNRVDRVIDLVDVAASLAQGHSSWIDIDLDNPQVSVSAMTTLKLNPRVVEAINESPSTGRHDVYEDCLHVSISVPRYVDRQLTFEIIDMILADRMIITLHHGPTPFIAQLHDSYPKFFHKFALSMGFLLFEIWDLLVDTLRRSLAAIEEDVELTQQSIFVGVSDEIFLNVSRLSGSVLELRKSTLAMRDALDQLATHTSAFVPATSQPYLLNMVGSLERLVGDLTVERETLAEALNLYLGIVSHRTNQLLHRLTLVSIVFMPLTFLCGVYGMNFNLPEYRWQYGNVFFWSLVLVVVTTMVTWMRAKKIW